jgi:hypothetical protein
VITDVNDKEDDAQHDDSLQAEEKQISASAVKETGFSARLFSHDRYQKRGALRTSTHFSRSPLLGAGCDCMPLNKGACDFPPRLAIKN